MSTKALVPNDMRYAVEVEFNRGSDDFILIWQGNDYDRGVTTANFWDERLNTLFVDRVAEARASLRREANKTYDERYRELMAKFDEAIARVSGSPLAKGPRPGMK